MLMLVLCPMFVFALVNS